MHQFSEPEILGSDVRKIWFNRKHRAMLVSRFTPQQTFCVGSQGWGLAGWLTSGFQVAFADADQLSAGGGGVGMGVGDKVCL